MMLYATLSILLKGGSMGFIGSKDFFAWYFCVVFIYF